MVEKKQVAPTKSTSGSNESTTSVVGRMIEKTKTVDAVWAGRVLFIICLLVVAGVLGFLGHYILDDTETKLAKKQFASIVDRALVTAQRITERKQLGALTLASVVANHLPNADPWPFVTFPNFEEITKNIIATVDGRSMGLVPLVWHEELSDFEEFAYNFYNASGFHNKTGLSSFGKGVWWRDPSLNTSDGRFWTGSSGGETPWGSAYKVHTPIFQFREMPHSILMIDLHWQELRGRVIDSFIDTSLEPEDKEEVDRCGGMTDFLQLQGAQTRPTPGAVIMHPIYPANNRTKLTGLIAASIAWEQTLEELFNDEVSGIDCVLCSDTVCNTYSVEEGNIVWDGEGDLHQESFENLGVPISLTDNGQCLSGVSSGYSLTMYPTSTFFKVYSTSNPTIATAGAVGAIFLTSLLFLLYDMFVRRDIRSKRKLLEAKRAFVRFVSHEVRTPLNSVMMGLTFLQEEMAKSLGYRSVEEIDTDPEANPLSPITHSPPTVLLNSGDAAVHRREILHFFRQSQEIHDNTQRAVSVLNDLLTYDKVEMGSMQLEFDIVSLPPLVEFTANEFKAAAAQKKIKYIVDFSKLECDLKKLGSYRSSPCPYPTTLAECRSICDDIRIAQVIRNLISNAIKFTREGGVISLTASYVMSDMSERNGFLTREFTLKRGEEISAPPCGALRVDVSDSGAGMTNEQLEVVFGDGVQFNANDLQKGNGTGLGLHIAKGIMDLHDGKLTASSEGLNKGTTFSMVTPLYCLPDTGNKGIKEDTQPSNTEHQEYLETGPLRLLVVDDARMNRKLLSRLLKNHDHICEEADDGDVAVDMVRKSMEEGTPFDTILLDNEMPRLSGPMAAKQMREVGSDVFIVGVTGSLLPDDVEEFKKCGANAVLPKPFKLASLEQLWIEYGISNDSPREEVLRITNGSQ